MKQPLVSIPGTVANVMLKELNKVDFNNMSLAEMKETVINILKNPAIKQVDLAQKYITEVNNMTNRSHLVSTVTTYITGIKLGKSKQF